MKIHDKPISKEKDKQNKHQEIEKDYLNYDLLSDVIQNKYNNFSTKTFSLRLNPELEPMLRVYADENNLTVAKSIENICESFFKKNIVTRNFFKLNRIMNIAIPLDAKVLGEYIRKNINVLIDVNDDTKHRLNSQSMIINKEATKNYLVASFSIGNNYLDTYQDKRYSANVDKPSDYNYIPVFNEYSLKQSHHIGLFNIYVEQYQQSIFLAVLYARKTPIDARFISKTLAINESERVNNQQLHRYIKNTESSDNMQNYYQESKERELYIKALEKQVQSLEAKNNELEIRLNRLADSDAEKNNSEYTSTIEKLEKENDALQEQIRLLSPEQQKIINNATNTINKYLEIYNNQLEQIKK